MGKTIPRPYSYRLTFDWSGDCLSEEHRGYRTQPDGTKESFLNSVFDGKDPYFVIKAEHLLYKFLENKPKSFGRLVVLLEGDQSDEILAKPKKARAR